MPRDTSGNTAALGFDQRDYHTMIPVFLREPAISIPVQYFNVSDLLFEFKQLVIMGDYFTVQCSFNEVRKLR